MTTINTSARVLLKDGTSHDINVNLEPKGSSLPSLLYSEDPSTLRALEHAGKFAAVLEDGKQVSIEVIGEAQISGWNSDEDYHHISVLRWWRI
jgi:hypothetical protein